MRRKNPFTKANRGFSLVELTIVIAVIGVIISAIWVYAGQAGENAKVQQLGEELATVANNVHSLYTGQANIAGSVSVLVPKLAGQNAIPTPMLRTGGACAGICADNPWGSVGNPGAGTFGVCAWAAGPSTDSTCATSNAATQYFAIELSGVSLAQCMDIVPQLSIPGSPNGLLDITVNGISAVKAGIALPATVDYAETNCAAANTVDFVYRLQPSAF